MSESYWKNGGGFKDISKHIDPITSKLVNDLDYNCSVLECFCGNLSGVYTHTNNIVNTSGRVMINKLEKSLKNYYFFGIDLFGDKINNSRVTFYKDRIQNLGKIFPDFELFNLLRSINGNQTISESDEYDFFKTAYRITKVGGKFHFFVPADKKSKNIEIINFVDSNIKKGRKYSTDKLEELANYSNFVIESIDLIPIKVTFTNVDANNLLPTLKIKNEMIKKIKCIYSNLDNKNKKVAEDIIDLINDNISEFSTTSDFYSVIYCKQNL